MFKDRSDAGKQLARKLAIKKRLRPNEYGLFKNAHPVAGATEEEVYRALGLPYIPPERRETAHGK